MQTPKTGGRYTRHADGTVVPANNATPPQPIDLAEPLDLPEQGPAGDDDIETED